MTALHGYFDGRVCVPHSTEALRPHQKVIITVLDEFASPRRDLKKYVGKVSREDSDAVAKAVEEGRKVDADAWHGIGTDTGIPPLV